MAWEIYIKGMHKLGHEGAVFKRLDSQYEYKRSNAWYKAKPTYDADLLIVGMQKGEGKYFDTLGALIVAGEVECKGVKTFVQCNLSGMDDAMRDWFWARKDNPEIISKMVVQVEFQNVTADGSLRFPRFIRIRDDK
jgi:ATP-dependent DNA ligase